MTPASSTAWPTHSTIRAHGVAVDLAALHPQRALVDLGVEEVGAAAVGAQDEARAAAVQLARGDDDGAGAVAEEHGGGAVLVVGQAAQRLGAEDEHDAGAAGLDAPPRPGRARR